MAARYGIVLPLWSYADDDGQLLERAAGEVGLDHITVPAITGPQSHFRLGGALERPYFQSEGGWHYPPVAKAYGVAGLRPPKARWFGTADHLARLREHLERLGLKLVLRVDLRPVPALLVQEPRLCQRNAWGQEVPTAGVCAGDAVARELLHCTLEDLLRYQPTAYELADWVPDHAVNQHAARPLAWHAEARQLLDLCFCPACRQAAERANCDPDQAARSVRVQLERLVGTAAGACDTDVAVAGYIAARSQENLAWLGRLAAADTQRNYDVVHELGQVWPNTERASLGVLFRLARGSAAADADELGLALRWDGWRGGGVSVPVWQPTFAEPAALVRFTSDAVRGGAGAFDFEGLDEAPPQAMTWLKQAVRFARRD